MWRDMLGVPQIWMCLTKHFCTSLFRELRLTISPRELQWTREEGAGGALDGQEQLQAELRAAWVGPALKAVGLGPRQGRQGRRPSTSHTWPRTWPTASAVGSGCVLIGPRVGQALWARLTATRGDTARRAASLPLGGVCWEAS